MICFSDGKGDIVLCYAGNDEELIRNAYERLLEDMSICHYIYFVDTVNKQYIYNANGKWQPYHQNSGLGKLEESSQIE